MGAEKLRICGKCGKSGHNARTCGKSDAQRRESRHGHKSKRKAKPGESWLKTIAKKAEQKLDEASGSVSESPELPKASGEPFADLPPLDLPSSSTPSSESDEHLGSEPSSTAPPADSSAGDAEKGPSGATAPKGTVKIDVEEIEAMLGPFVEQGVRAAGAYATSQGFFALGDPFPRLAREAACIIIRKRANEIGIDEEEYAAWLLGGIVGVNGVQAFRAYKQESATKAAEKKQATKAKVQDVRPVAEPGPDGAREAVNGTYSAPPAPADDQPRFQLAGPIV